MAHACIATALGIMEKDVRLKANDDNPVGLEPM
jgi:hypothetical protein